MEILLQKTTPSSKQMYLTKPRCFSRKACPWTPNWKLMRGLFSLVLLKELTGFRSEQLKFWASTTGHSATDSRSTVCQSAEEIRYRPSLRNGSNNFCHSGPRP